MTLNNPTLIAKQIHDILDDLIPENEYKQEFLKGEPVCDYLTVVKKGKLFEYDLDDWKGKGEVIEAVFSISWEYEWTSGYDGARILGTHGRIEKLSQKELAEIRENYTVYPNAFAPLFKREEWEDGCVYEDMSWFCERLVDRLEVQDATCHVENASDNDSRAEIRVIVKRGGVSTGSD